MYRPARTTRRSCSARSQSISQHRNRGVGSALVERAIDMARAAGHQEILLVGDAPYYGRFGFSAERTANLDMPGPFERSRLLSLAFTPVEEEAAGLITATGVAAAAPAPALAQPSSSVERRHRRRFLVRAA
jgi:GNAT superfamily N-acetyltransferase